VSEIQIVGLAKRFADVWAVRDASFAVDAGAFVTLLGPSGCGKTTTLRLIAGFETPDRGDILLGGRRINEVPPWRRGLGVVFQSYALFPFMTVYNNVAFGLRRQGLGEAAISTRVGAALDLVNLPGLERRYPRQLSGGQQQRVALARALVIEPRVLLLDEPLSNLDAKLRAEMRDELKRIQRETGVTTVLVTHDQDEALTLSNTIVVMRDGAIVATGSPRAIWNRPGKRFVADFLGVDNLLPARRADGGRIRFEGGGPALEVEGGGAATGEGRIVVGIRARDIELGPTPAGAPVQNEIDGNVRESIYRGSFFTCRVTTDAGPLSVTTPLDLAPGAAVRLRLPRERIMLLEDDAAGPG